MTDITRRAAERGALASGGPLDKRAQRVADLRATGCLELDLSIPCAYEVVEGATYARVQAALRDPSKLSDLQPVLNGYARMLTGGEAMRVRVKEAKTGEGDLWKWFQFTSTGIAYCANDDSRFKIVPRSADLVGLPPDFRQRRVDITYDSIEGIELRVQDAPYDEPLTEREIVEHPFWQRMLQQDNLPFSEENRATLTAYARIAIETTQEAPFESHVMSVYLTKWWKQDCLYPFNLGGRGDDGYAGICDNPLPDDGMDGDVRALRVCPR